MQLIYTTKHERICPQCGKSTRSTIGGVCPQCAKAALVWWRKLGVKIGPLTR